MQLTNVCDAIITAVRRRTSSANRGAFCRLQKSQPTVTSAHLGGTMTQEVTRAVRGSRSARPPEE